MACTDIHSISVTVGKAVDYIVDADKTKGSKLVSSVGCSKNGDDVEKEFEMIRNLGTKQGGGEILAQHIYQSFSPGEVTPEQAHEIGVKLADELLKGKYQYVLATHIDKGHIHNHLIFNNIDLVNFRSFEYQENRGGKVFEKLRKISDDLCRENGLNVIENPEMGKGKSYYEWMQNVEGLSWKAQLKSGIDNAIMNSSNFDEFLDELKSKNIECVYKPENVISLKFRMEGQQRFCRARTLGWYYEEHQVRRRIDNYQLIKTGQTVTPQRSKLIDTSSEKIQNSKGLSRWADIQNMKEASRLLNILSEQNIADEKELEQRSIEKYGNRVELVGSLNSLQSKIDEFSETINQIKKYLKFKPYNDAYQKSTFKKKYAKENASALEKYKSVKDILSKKFPDKKIPTLERLYEDRSELITQRNQKNKDYKSLVAELKELDYARTTIEQYVSQNRDKTKEKDNSLH